MRVKRSKDPVSGKKLDSMTVRSRQDMVEVILPNKCFGYDYLVLTKKEARRLASALLEFVKTLE